MPEQETENPLPEHSTETDDDPNEPVTCVLDTHARADGKLSWCGQYLVGFHFLDVDHAAMNGREGGMRTVCPDCLKAITAALNNGQDEVPA